MSDTLKKWLKAAKSANQDAETRDTVRAAHPYVVIDADGQPSIPLTTSMQEAMQRAYGDARRAPPGMRFGIHDVKRFDDAFGPETPEGYSYEPLTRRPFFEMGAAAQHLDALAAKAAALPPGSPVTADPLLTLSLAMADAEVGPELARLSRIEISGLYGQLARGQEPLLWAGVCDAAAVRRPDEVAILVAKKRLREPAPAAAPAPAPPVAQPDYLWAGGHPRTALVGLLVALFSAPEMDRLIRYDFPRQHGEIAWGAYGATHTATAILDTLQQHGCLGHVFWAALERERPRRVDEIRAVRERWESAPENRRG